MTSRSLGHRAPLPWLVLPLMAGLSPAARSATLARYRGNSPAPSAQPSQRWWAPAIGELFNHAALTMLVAIDALIRAGVRVPGGWWPAQWRTAWAAPMALALLLLAAVLAGYAMGWRHEQGGWCPPFAAAALALMLGVAFG